MSPRTTQQFEKIRKDSREKILTVALKLFSEHGFYNTSIRKIARQAGISDGLLYNYFKSKEELAMAVLQGAFSTLDNTLVLDNNLSPHKNLEQSITNFIGLLENHLDKIRLLAQMGIHKEKFDFLNTATIHKYKASVEHFELLLSRINYPSPQTEAMLLVAILDGLVLEVLLMDGGVNLEQARISLIQKYCS